MVAFGGAAAAAPPVLDPPAVRDWPDHDAAARGELAWTKLVSHGASLFRTKFNEADGAGRPGATGDSKPTPRKRSDRGFHRIAGPDANSCAGCHNDPIAGGSGEFVSNVFVGAHFSDPVIDHVHPEATNERNTTSIQGAGLIEMLAREITAELHALRRVAMELARREGREIETELRVQDVFFGWLRARADGTVDTSRFEGVDDDLVIKPFGAKGVAVSLREFTVFALNQHHGMQAVERFGWERTGRRDFDGDGKEIEITIGQVSALAAFQASLPPPMPAPTADSGQEQQRMRGQRLFAQVGCASCHRPHLTLRATSFVEPNPYNRPGALGTDGGRLSITGHLPAAPPAPGQPLLVRAFTDFKRHRICDDERPQLCNERRRQDNVPTDHFMTARLWDLASSAPYCHRGDCLSVSEAIDRHGGAARAARRQYEALPDADKRAVLEFLLSLGGSPPALP